MGDAWVVQAYEPRCADEWNRFIARSRNGVFLFDRGYMDYHADRFQDASVMVRDARNARLMAVLPLHRVTSEGQSTLISHGGLTFGGLVMDPKLGGSAVLAIFEALVSHWRHQGVSRLVYRPVPHIYHRLPSEDDLYALHRLGARLGGVQLSSTLDLARPVPASEARNRVKAKANRLGVTVRPACFSEYWPLLESTLARRHGVKPVHSLDEIRLLSDRFKQIELNCAVQASGGSGDILAGTVLYCYDGVMHAQYLAASEDGYQVGAMNALMEHCIRDAKERGMRWFSFGTSTYDGGKALNDGLLRHKEQFGARSTVLQSYELDIGG
ncbi:MAG: GNAT family N-acetyltransferase [Lautropia sp.]|nr:GNAT family N-acetyltransferase [Lautropia sp.]